MPKLPEEVRDLTGVRHYSLRTEQAYVSWIKQCILLHEERHPAEVGEREVTEFLSHLARDQRVAASTEPGLAG